VKQNRKKMTTKNSKNKTFKSLCISKAAIFYFFTASILLFNHNSFAAQKIQEVNYFSSLRSEETNVRSGPGQNYPIKFTFKLRGIPVRVISEYDNWNEIQDYEGQSGWVTKSLLTKKRTLMVKTSKTFVNMYSKNNEKSRIIFRLENQVIGDYLKCLDGWCGIKINNKKGWVQQVDLFGTDDESSEKSSAEPSKQ
jgi:SH3-like domain-containing protein